MPKRNLKTTRVSQVYRLQLVRAWKLLISFALWSRFPHPKTLADDPTTANELLVACIQFLYENDKYVVRDGTHVILAVQFFVRPLRGHLKESWDTLDSWAKEFPPQPRVPMPHVVMLAVSRFARLLASSRAGFGSVKWWVFSVLLEVGYYAVLRPVEFLSLTRALVMLPTSLVSSCSYAVVGIRNPKNRKQLGNMQFSIVRDEGTTRWLTWLCADLPPDTKLWSSSAAEFRTMFKYALGKLGLGSAGFTPASLRAGGGHTLLPERGGPVEIEILGALGLGELSHALPTRGHGCGGPR